MQNNYLDSIRKPLEDSTRSKEAEVGYAVDTITAVNTKYAFMHDFVISNYSAEEAKAIEAKNFMIGSPFTFDSVETEDDWNKIETESEKSGIASAESVKSTFGRWHNL